MALHEQSVGKTDEWYTPAFVFDAMGVIFDLDPCTPAEPMVPSRYRCRQHYTRNGLTRPWEGFVWMNPPFGGRNAIIPWLAKFMSHGDGVALTPDRTSCPWWQEYARKADLVLFVDGKINFIGEDGQPGRSPAQGTTLMAAGPRGVVALQNAARAGLGTLMKVAA